MSRVLHHHYICAPMYILEQVVLCQKVLHHHRCGARARYHRRLVARWIVAARAQLGMLRVTSARHVEDKFTLIDFVRHVNK